MSKSRKVLLQSGVIYLLGHINHINNASCIANCATNLYELESPADEFSIWRFCESLFSFTDHHDSTSGWYLRPCCNISVTWQWEYLVVTFQFHRLSRLYLTLEPKTFLPSCIRVFNLQLFSKCNKLFKTKGVDHIYSKHAY